MFSAALLFESQVHDCHSVLVLSLNLPELQSQVRSEDGDEKDDGDEKEDGDEEEDEKEDMRIQLADFEVILAERKKSQAFPLILPSELRSNSDVEAAHLTLGLVEKELHVMIESNFAEEKRKYLIDHPYIPSKSIQEQDTEFTFRYWYVHLRRFLIQLSFDRRTFFHRFEGKRFLPLIPAQTFKDRQKRAVAFEAFGSMKPELIPKVDAKLWSGWIERKEVAELMDENVADAFNDYVQHNYVSTILSVTRDCVNDLVRFVPRVSPEVGNNQELSVRRQKLLLKADSTDDASAQVGVNRLYVEFVASKKKRSFK